MKELASAWMELAAPSTPQTWTASKVSQRARVARLEDGGAALLVKLDAHDSSNERYRLRTTHVELTPSRSLTIHTGEEAESGNYLVLLCSGADVALVRQFLRIAQILPLDESPDVIVAAVTELFELFRSIGRRGTHTVQGIWAETLLVVHANDPAYLVEAWHSDNAETHDFVGDGMHLEVKSSTRGIREHELSLEQLEFSTDSTVLASLLLLEETSGATIFDLLSELRPRLPTFELRRRAENIVAKALGQDWQDAEELRFAVGPALASLALYPAAAVPRPPGPIPATVRAVHFRADLSGVVEQVTQTGRLLEALPKLSPEPQP